MQVDKVSGVKAKDCSARSWSRGGLERDSAKETRVISDLPSHSASAAELLSHGVLWASAPSNPGHLTMPEMPVLRLIPLQNSQVGQMSRSPRSCMSVQSKSSGPS